MSHLEKTARRTRRTGRRAARAMSRRSRGNPPEHDALADWARWRMPPNAHIL